MSADPHALARPARPPQDSAHEHSSAHADGHVAHHFVDARQQHEAAILGMWAFLATEVLFFGGLFLAYVVYRTLAPVQVATAAHHLNVWLGALNTAVLLVSSLLVALAVREAMLGNARAVVRLLLATIALGALFLIVKAFEWSADWHEHLVPFFGNWDWSFHLLARDRERMLAQGVPPEHIDMYRMFYVLYFFMTGLHGIHVIVGLGVFGVIAALVWKKRETGGFANMVEVSGLYWHFVDIVWVFLYPLLYLIDRHAH
jgi:cytochrome c oxidase subunit 3